MATPEMRFNDGAAYERMMGVWSRSVGEIFLDWLAPTPGLTWADIGCGSGAFSELLAERCAPARIFGIDPSEAQLTYARARPAARVAEFRQGDAMALPYADASMDAAAMALVLFFVPDPAKGVAEMTRVVKPGGSISAYLWDIVGGGIPFSPFWSAMEAMGIHYALPPSAAISDMAPLRAAWEAASIASVQTREIRVARTFASFDEFWSVMGSAASISDVLKSLSAEDLAALRTRVRAALPAAADGTIRYESRANAVKGVRP